MLIAQRAWQSELRLDLFDRRRQLIVYRFFFEPGVAGWPDEYDEPAQP